MAQTFVYTCGFITRVIPTKVVVLGVEVSESPNKARPTRQSLLKYHIWQYFDHSKPKWRNNVYHLHKRFTNLVVCSPVSCTTTLFACDKDDLVGLHEVQEAGSHSGLVHACGRMLTMNTGSVLIAALCQLTMYADSWPQWLLQKEQLMAVFSFSPE